MSKILFNYFDKHLSKISVSTLKNFFLFLLYLSVVFFQIGYCQGKEENKTMYYKIHHQQLIYIPKLVLYLWSQVLLSFMGSEDCRHLYNNLNWDSLEIFIISLPIFYGGLTHTHFIGN